MPVVIDQTGQHLSIDHPPQRIISLVPSQTELLFDFGLDKEVVGITKFCIHPQAWFRTKTRVGGTKQLRMEVIADLRPDLIIANKEENVREQVEALQKNYRVWVTDVNDLDTALDMIVGIGNIVDKKEAAAAIATKIGENFANLPVIADKPRVAYLIWQNPLMTVGGDTFIHSMLDRAGFENVFKNKTRYPEITTAELQEARPDFVLLSSEPFPFNEKHIAALQPLLPKSQIILVDGEIFSWYGTRMLTAPSSFGQLREQIK